MEGTSLLQEKVRFSSIIEGRVMSSRVTVVIACVYVRSMVQKNRHTVQATQRCRLHERCHAVLVLWINDR